MIANKRYHYEICTIRSWPTTLLPSCSYSSECLDALDLIFALVCPMSLETSEQLLHTATYLHMLLPSHTYSSEYLDALDLIFAFVSLMSLDVSEQLLHSVPDLHMRLPSHTYFSEYLDTLD